MSWGDVFIRESQLEEGCVEITLKLEGKLDFPVIEVTSWLEKRFKNVYIFISGVATEHRHVLVIS